LSTNGDTYLGGDDLDRTIMQHWLTQAGLSIEELKEHRTLAQGLRLKAEEAKNI